MAGEQLLVLYDADCGFCAWCVGWLLRWDRRLRLRPVAIDSELGERLLSGLTEDERLKSWHVCDEHGLLASGGPALAPVLGRLPGGGAPAAVLRRCPTTVARAYRWVAQHRVALGRLVPAASKDSARALINARMH